MVRRLGGGLYILNLPGDPRGPSTVLLVENARLESAYRRDPLVITSEDGLTLWDLAIRASMERARRVTRLETYIPLKWGVDSFKGMLTGDGTRIVKIYYNRQMNVVKAEVQTFGAKTPLGVTTVNKWARSSIELLAQACSSALLTLATTPGVQGYLPDAALRPYLIQALYEIIDELDGSAR
ncbi:hypothetical protein [Hyperthermus butylicus]|uniref:Uncharacterized protein n=1 Tax=Hyperthermus butylicus (strain DSM 5456 / JCM 9403 / PLM1-5) TaxID=415426 RepID=A2BLZ1_HYPBU|nr:hypothetical protein [Hyperthermus butylicus]ABM81002.1 hypothetical protein Hbut_1167 [Hyperthermus butylicus DSM 5456]